MQLCVGLPNFLPRFSVLPTRLLYPQHILLLMLILLSSAISFLHAPKLRVMNFAFDLFLYSHRKRRPHSKGGSSGIDDDNIRLDAQDYVLEHSLLSKSFLR